MPTVFHPTEVREVLVLVPVQEQVPVRVSEPVLEQVRSTEPVREFQPTLDPW